MTTRDSPISERILAAIGVLVGGFGAFLVWNFNPATTSLFPVCMLHSLTGFSCPGCGLTRGFHAFFHGDFLVALQFNLMLPAYFLILSYIGISLGLIAIRGRGLSYSLFTPKSVYLFFAVALVFGILRNLPFYPFSLFAT